MMPDCNISSMVSFNQGVCRRGSFDCGRETMGFGSDNSIGIGGSFAGPFMGPKTSWNCLIRAWYSCWIAVGRSGLILTLDQRFSIPWTAFVVGIVLLGSSQLCVNVMEMSSSLTLPSSNQPRSLPSPIIRLVFTVDSKHPWVGGINNPWRDEDELRLITREIRTACCVFWVFLSGKLTTWFGYKNVEVGFNCTIQTASQWPLWPAMRHPWQSRAFGWNWQV